MQEQYELMGLLKPDASGVDFDNGKAVARILKGWLDKPLHIVIKVFRNKRSDAQNRYIHGVVVVCVRAWLKETQGIDYTHDEVYMWLRTGLLGYKPVIKEIMGEQVIVMTGKRFSKMNTAEFAEAINIIIDKMAEQDCIIPLPQKENFIQDFIVDK